MHEGIDLNEYKTNTYSQFGEDGILEKIFQCFGTERGVFCEFGAWDGKYMSNAYNLYQHGWRGCLIEGQEARYQDLVRNIPSKEILKVCAFITPTGLNTLDAIIARSGLFQDGLPIAIDMLSIDIDSDDLAMWRSVTTFRPRAVVIEYNPTIPVDVFFENPLGENKGNSARSIFEYARSINYALVAVTHTNLIFVDERQGALPFRTFEITDPELSLGSRYFFGYDGTLITKPTGPSTPYDTPEVLVTPWRASFFSQPVRKMFRHFDDGRLNYFLNLALSVATTGIVSPLQVSAQLRAMAKNRRERKKSAISSG